MPDDIAERLIEENKLEDAVTRLEDVLASRDDAGLRLRLASTLFRIGKIGDALAHARRSADAESEHRADAVLLVAFCLRSLKRYRESARTYIEFAEKFPDSSNLRMARFSAALCLEELDDWRGAIEIYERISDDEAEFRRAICLERSGRPDEAAQIFEGFLDRFAESPEMLKVRFRLGSMRLRQGRIDEATKHLAETIRLGEGTFIGQLAKQLIEKAKVKAADTARKLKGYS